MKKQAILVLIFLGGFSLGIRSELTWTDWAQSQMQNANQRLYDNMKRYQGSLILGGAATATYLGVPTKYTAPMLALYWLIFKAFKTKIDEEIEDFVYKVKYSDPNYSTGFQLGSYYVTLKAKDGIKADITLSKKVVKNDLSLECKGEYTNLQLTDENLKNGFKKMLGIILDR